MINERANQIPESNKVIAYIDGMAILQLAGKNELYYCNINAAYVTIGEHLVEAESRPISLLGEQQQRKIAMEVM